MCHAKWKAFESQKARLLRGVEKFLFKINDPKSQKWKNYVSLHTLI